MPEYLAPGVYVEETSFRARSIEGVSTSTTGFVGMTRKGPYFIPGVAEDTPELLTSFGDFERVYGGLDDLPSGPNYMAHAVRAYFENGGRRLFVSRVFAPSTEANPDTLSADSSEADRAGFGLATSVNLVDGTTAATRARWVARFPGSAGNGEIFVRQVASPATLRSLDSAPVGSMLLVGGRNPALPGSIEGGRPPFALRAGANLLLTVGDVDVDVAVEQTGARLTATTPIQDPVTLADADATLTVVVDGIEHVLQLPTVSTPRAALVALIDAGIANGSAEETQTGRLAIDSNTIGTGSSVEVRQNTALGFASDRADRGGNVGNASSVGVEELNALLAGASAGARATRNPLNGNLVLTTTAVGADASIEVRGDPANQHMRLGLLSDLPAGGQAGTASTYFVKTTTGWRDASGDPLDTGAWQATGTAPAALGADLVSLTVIARDGDGYEISYDDVHCDPAHPRWVGSVLSPTPGRRADALENLFGIEIGERVTPFQLRDALVQSTLGGSFALRGGNEGLGQTAEGYRQALGAIEGIEDISIVAAPDAAQDRDLAQATMNHLISHVERRRAYRIAVLDVPRDMTPMEALELRSRVDSHRAALYYPWVVIPNPLARPGDLSVDEELAIPPSGSICGIYARNDNERGVFKAPANEVVRGALRFNQDINFGQQEVLNPRGVNCLRYFPGRGYRVWGARTATSDPEFKYVSVRRYFNYLERSVDNGTQWVVFEPNGERLWANVRETISTFLYNEWVSGALLGDKPEKAFFVKCDRSTMTQNNLDNGQLVCLIGVAVVKPAEFVIFRIGQKTADQRG